MSKDEPIKLMDLADVPPENAEAYNMVLAVLDGKPTKLIIDTLVNVLIDVALQVGAADVVMNIFAEALAAKRAGGAPPAGERH